MLLPTSTPTSTSVWLRLEITSSQGCLKRTVGHVDARLSPALPPIATILVQALHDVHLSLLHPLTATILVQVHQGVPLSLLVLPLATILVRARQEAVDDLLSPAIQLLSTILVQARQGGRQDLNPPTHRGR